MGGGGATPHQPVDLDGACAGKPVNHEVAPIVKAVDIPCQIGGGLRDEASISLSLGRVGVGRVIVGRKCSSSRTGSD